MLARCCSDPNQAPGERSSSLGEWPLHTPTSREYIELNSRFLGRQPADRSRAVGRGPLLAECAFWGIYLPQLVERTGRRRFLVELCVKTASFIYLSKHRRQKGGSHLYAVKINIMNICRINNNTK